MIRPTTTRPLLLLVLVAVVFAPTVDAGILDWFGFQRGNATSSESSESSDSEDSQEFGAEEPKFYREDKLANVAMMLDFADEPLYLVALFKWRDLAVYEDGRSTNLTGFEADKLYTQAMFSDIVPGVGGEAKFIANVQKTGNLITSKEGEPLHLDWDALAVIEFPSGIAFGRMLPNQKFQALSPHKKAGLEYHAIFACELVEGSSMESTGFADQGGGFDDANSAVSVVEMYDYKRYADYNQEQEEEGGVDVVASRSGSESNVDEQEQQQGRRQSGADAASLYLETANAQAMAEDGMRTAAVFKVKQSLISGAPGIDSDWDEVRINTYPTADSLEKAKAIPNPAWHHLEAGVNRASELEVSPMFFNSLGGNAQMGYYEACASESRVQIASEQQYDASSYCP